jgi:hypothetical protein
VNLLYRFIYQNCVYLSKYIKEANNVCISLDLYWVIKVNQDFCNSVDLLRLVCSAGHAINNTYAVYTRYAKKACLQNTSSYQSYDLNKVLQIKQISPIWDAMRSC